MFDICDDDLLQETNNESQPRETIFKFDTDKNIAVPPTNELHFSTNLANGSIIKQPSIKTENHPSRSTSLFERNLTYSARRGKTAAEIETDRLFADL
jgi:hypothetical protein